MFIELPRPLYWEGSSKKDFQTFPLAVQKHLGMSLFIVQSGRQPAASTPRPDIALISRRLKQVQARYGPHKRQP